MKYFILLLIALPTLGFSQSYQYKPAEQYTPNYQPTTPPSNQYTPPPSYKYEQAEKSITLNNKTMQAKQVAIYTLNTTTYKWDYLQTVRIVGGGSQAYSIGQYELHSDYGYKVVGDYSDQIKKFGSYPVNLY